MKCYPKSELQEYLLERLEPQRDAEVSQHLQQCHACRSSLDALSDDEVVRDYLDAVKREELAGKQEPTLPVPEPNAKKFDANWIAALIDQRDLPKRFGRFELRELLGTGGFGAVYLAWDTELGRQVAIKIPHLVRLSPLFRKRFLQEARAAASLCHPNIVSVLESGEFEGIGYIVSEYIPGPTLREHLRTRRPRFRATDAANLVCALAKAIDHAHQHKIVHRDIKPSNVLLDERTRTGALPFRPMLTDFGTARLVDADQSATVEEVLIGTAPYMAPEQIVSGDIRLESDIYALGVLLFELISGHPPIQGFDSTTTMHRIATMDSPELRDTVAGVPRDLSAICSKCLEKDPKQRYASAANLAEDLQRFLDHVPTIARPIGTGRRIARWCRRNPIPSTVVAATFFSLALIIADQSWNAATLRRVNQLLTDANKRVEKSEKRTRVLLYAADLRLAKLSWNQGDIQTVRELVSRYIPRKGEDDLRGIEWHFLEKELRPNQYLIANHGKPLYDLAINPAQGIIATAGQAGVIYIHDLNSSNLLYAIDSGQIEVNGLAFSSSGQLLASTGDDGSICIWNNGDLVRRIPGHQGKAYGVDFIKNDARLVTCGTDSRVKIWDVETGESLHSYTDHTDEVEALTVTGSGRWLASVGKDHQLIIRDLNSDAPAFKIATQNGILGNVAFSTDERFVATVASGGEVKALTIFDLVNRTQLAESSISTAFVSVCFSDSGDRLLTTDRSGTLRIWELTENSGNLELSKKPIAVIPMRDDRIYASEYLYRTDTIISVGHSGNVLATRCNQPAEEISINDKAIASSLDLESEIQFRSFAFRPQSKDLIVAANSVIAAVNFQSGEHRVLHRSDGRLWNDVVVSANGEWILIAGFDPVALALRKVRLAAAIARIELASGEEEVLWTSSEACVLKDLALSDNGQFLAVTAIALRESEEVTKLLILDAKTGNVRYEFVCSSGSVAKFLPNSTRLVYGDNNDIHLVDAIDGRNQRIEAAHQHAQNQLAVSSNGLWLATCDQERVIKIWQLPDMRLHATLLGHAGHINALSFSADDRTLFSAGLDGTIKAWNVEVGRLVMNIREKKDDPIRSMALSKDGRKMAYSDANGWLRIFVLRAD